jgi:ribose/xylose/arabinose/galactoside ABC-type transport system permease subunit
LLDGYLIIVGRAKKLIVSLNTLSAIDGCYLMIVSSLHEGKARRMRHSQHTGIEKR